MEQAREGIFNIKNNSKGLNKLFISTYKTLLQISPCKIKEF